ncbi:MAG: response regulator [Paracoccaceae bacterium]
MKALIVESKAELGRIWASHLERQGIETTLAANEAEAVTHLRDIEVDVLIVDLVLDRSNALAVADFASFRQPNARVIFVTNTSFFSDGSIFRLYPNACAFIQADSPPEDIAALAHHHASKPR